MRSAGSVARLHGYGCSDHACCAYSSREERDSIAVDWLLDGAEQGQRLVVVTDDEDGGAGLTAAFAAAAPAAPHEGLVVFPLAEVYDLSRPIDPPAQLAIYQAVVAQAIADGFNGLRVVADITPLIADPARQSSHAAWEHYADAWMARGNALAPLCIYDARVITDPPEAVLAVHPLRRPPAGTRASFGLYWADDRRVLEGSVDAFGVAALSEILSAIPDQAIEIDVHDLEFLNGGGAMALAQARSADSGQPPVRLVGAQPLVRRVWEVLGLDESVCL